MIKSSKRLRQDALPRIFSMHHSFEMRKRDHYNSALCHHCQNMHKFCLDFFFVGVDARASLTDEVCEAAQKPYTQCRCILFSRNEEFEFYNLYCPANGDVWTYPGTYLAIRINSPPPPPCPVAPLTPITNPVAQQHENGPYTRHPDLEHVTPATSAGAACILQEVAGLNATATVTSGFRPPTYQAHLREVWDKWQLLRNNTTEVCRVIKEDVRAHWDRHGMVRQPGLTSNHSAGTAVDIGGVPEGSADAIATQCIMYRPLADDPVHYQPR